MESSSINERKPLKIVLLGGAGVGKSTFANLVYSKFFRETYYPTHKSTMILFDFKPNSDRAKCLLDEQGGVKARKLINKNLDLILSPILFQSFCSRSALEDRSFSSKSKVIKNEYYSQKYEPTSMVDDYVPPTISPITVELIDTPPFKPDMVVPFLEVSLYRNLDKEDLHNLANEPRRPVSTNPLLVASGASELDGNVDGYIFMYSAVPNLTPPSYDDVNNDNSNDNNDKDEEEDNNNNNNDKTGHKVKNINKQQDEQLNLLEIIRGAIFDAWREYRTYQRKKKKGEEGDVYSLVYGIKQLWKHKSIQDEQKRLDELRSISTHLDDLNIDPSSPDSPPPILIVCTNAKHPYHSPLLIEEGKKLANEWKSSFILVDNELQTNVDETFSLLIREIIERKKLQKRKK